MVYESEQDSRSSLRPLRERDRELTALCQAADAAAAGHPQFAVVSGLRRVGKTFLLQHLMERQRPGTAVYFEATQAGETAQLRRFAEALRQALGPDGAPPFDTFASWEQALELCAYVARSRPLTVILDEATYLMDSSHGFASTVQAVWDGIASSAHGPALLLVLSGSEVGMVEDALDYRGPLYQRPTVVLPMKPFTAAQAYRYLSRPDPTALLEAYAACGGYPLHLDAWDFGGSTGENLLRLAGSPGGLLLEDGAALLYSLRDPMRRVLLAVGQGRTRPNEIGVDASQPRVDRPLEAVQRARLVEGTTPLGAPHKAKPIYRIADPYLRFWLRLLANHVQRVEAGQGAAVLEHGEGEWQHHIGTVFEEAAREHGVRLVQNGTLPSGTLIGEWWATSGDQCQVDVLGIKDHRTILIGEARWQRQPLGPRDVDALARKQQLVPKPVAQPLLILWGRGGVRPEVVVGQVRGYSLLDVLDSR
ncbi:MAG: ATP-binding protein [Acidimicrobiales bacterium]